MDQLERAKGIEPGVEVTRHARGIARDGSDVQQRRLQAEVPQLTVE